MVKVDPNTGKSETVKLSNKIDLPRDLRGGSQVIPFGDYHIAVTHEVDLFDSEVGRKDGIYLHRFVVWDKDWNIHAYSKEFTFMGADVEFCIGMQTLGDDFIFTFGYQDNAAYILKCPQNTIIDFLNYNY